MSAQVDQTEAARVAYEQHYESFRDLNKQMWQVPVIAITLTGGLWYGVTQIDNWLVHVLLLVFAGISDLGLIVVLHRVRFIMGRLLKKLEEIYPEYYVDAGSGVGLERGKVVVWVFTGLLCIAALFSFVMAIYFGSCA